MNAFGVLQKRLRHSIPSVHLKRLNVLMAAVGSAVSGGRLTLSSLARHLAADTTVRHRIKRVDRLLGNCTLHDERTLFYRVLCELLIGAQHSPVLIVDWSDLKADRRWQVLRATVWVHGFALPIYEEVHPLKLQNNRRVQAAFLETLRNLLPDSVQPIVVADAGFRSTWFDEVSRIGWHWVGRVRGRTLIWIDGQWQPCKSLFAKATGTPRDLGLYEVTRSRPVQGRLCLYRKAAQGRHHLNCHGRRAQGHHSQKNAHREREPWLLIASPSLADKSALQVVQLYRTRMRIEHSFRTLKSHQFGFAYEDSQTRIGERLAVLLLIHALALLLTWIAGWAAQRRRLDLRLRSNVTVKNSLSIISLGWMAITLLGTSPPASDFNAALRDTTAPPTLDST